MASGKEVAWKERCYCCRSSPSCSSSETFKAKVRKGLRDEDLDTWGCKFWMNRPQSFILGMYWGDSLVGITVGRRWKPSPWFHILKNSRVCGQAEGWGGSEAGDYACWGSGEDKGPEKPLHVVCVQSGCHQREPWKWALKSFNQIKLKWHFLLTKMVYIFVYYSFFYPLVILT